jgi:multidrug resistance efflux pump
MMREFVGRHTRVVTVAAALLLLAIVWQRTASSEVEVPTAAVRQGTFEDVLTLRGEVRPSRSVIVSAPSRGGDLRIIRIARTGTRVKAGDTIVEFDRTNVLRTLSEKTSEFKRADAEVDRIRAQRRIAEQKLVTASQKARFDVERARLDTRGEDLLSRVELEQKRLAVIDAESALRVADEKLTAEQKAAEAELRGAQQKREKARREVEDAKQQLQQLSIVAPTDGIVAVLQNFRGGGAGGAEFREGDRPWNGAALAELPDLSKPVVIAKLDESERARLKEGQRASVRIDAVPDKDFNGTLKTVSALTRADFTQWPPLRNFEATIVLEAVDPHLRAGMNATARLVTERVGVALLVPVNALFALNGRTVCYVRTASGFVPRPVQVERRGTEDAMVSGVSEGDVIATERPPS